MDILCLTFAFFPYETHTYASNPPSVPSAFMLVCASPLVYHQQVHVHHVVGGVFETFVDAQPSGTTLDVLLLELLLDFRAISILCDWVKYLVPCWIHCNHYSSEQVEPLLEVFWFHVIRLGLRQSLEIAKTFWRNSSNSCFFSVRLASPATPI